MKNFKIGDRVFINGKPGTIHSQRMSPPDYNTVDSFCVMMDHRIEQAKVLYGEIWSIGYKGTTVGAEEVSPIE